MKKLLFLVAAAGLQLAIIGGLFARARMPLLVGEEIRVAVRPVDPRSLFRGNYAELTYDFGSLGPDLLDGIPQKMLGRGQVIYVQMAENDGLWEATGVSLEQPEEGIYLRGRTDQRRWWSGHLRVNYGIEAWFAAKHDAIALEEQVRDRSVQTIAVLKVAPGGRVALADIEARPRR